MTRVFLKDAFVWGSFLWVVGYILGIVLFAVLPSSVLGWVIMPIGVALTVWILFTRIKSTTLSCYLSLSIVWTLLAIIFDYVLLVNLFKPSDGYYKLDVYLYYFFTFTLPLVVGWWKTQKLR